MQSFTYKPALLAKTITVTLENGVLNKQGEWSLDLSTATQVRRNSTNVRLHRFDEVEISTTSGQARRLGVSVPQRGAADEQTVQHTLLINAIIAAVPPDTPLCVGQKRWVKWVMAVLALAMVGLGGVILTLEGLDEDTIGPALTALATGAILGYIYNPFRANLCRRCGDVAAEIARLDWGAPKN